MIPARSGSKRVRDKNIRLLEGHPVLAYSIRAAVDSGVFDAVICATDSEAYAEIATHYGAEVPALRPGPISGDKSPDIERIEWLLQLLGEKGRNYDAFSILRPTSPFRKAETIQRAWRQFLGAREVDSLRAVELCDQHPGKMWIVQGATMVPLLPFGPATQPWHSTPYAALPPVYVQNASLEIAWTRVVRETRTIAGSVLTPFLTEGDEGLDINREFDWWKAERLLDRGEATLPPVSVPAWNSVKDGSRG
jgi:CMP-N-acetylneuraminic acid synthetase